MKNASFLTVSLVVFTTLFSCHQAIRVPGPVTTQVAKVERRANHGVKFGNYGIPEVKRTSNVSKSIAVNLPFAVAERVNIKMASTFPIQKSGVTLSDMACESKLIGKAAKLKVMMRDNALHSIECTGTTVQWSINEVKRGEFIGSLKMDGKEYVLTGTNAMAKGPPTGASGFHVYDGTKWIGSIENFYFGLAYPSVNMPEESHDAFGVAVVMVAATGDFLGKDAQSIQSNPIAFSQ
jgi:hypothetical protein